MQQRPKVPVCLANPMDVGQNCKGSMSVSHKPGSFYQRTFTVCTGSWKCDLYGTSLTRLPASKVSVQFSPVRLPSFPIKLLSPSLDSRARWLGSAPHNRASLRESLMGKNNAYNLSTHLCLWHCQIWGSVSLLFCSQCQWIVGPSLGLPYSWVFSSHSVSQVNFLFKT